MIELIRLSDFAWPVTVEQFKAAHPDVGLPSDPTILEQIDWSATGYARILPTPMPVYDPLTQTVRAVTPGKADGQWWQQWEVVGLPTDQIAANQAAAQAALIARYTSALDAHIDAEARKDRWDSRITCVARASYPNVWQNRAVAFGTWMDTCYVLAYQVLAEVQAGTRTLPTIEEFLALMPVMEWPA